MTDSPCVNVCTLDSDFVCIGCGRHIKHIMRWSEMTPEQRIRAIEAPLR